MLAFGAREWDSLGTMLMGVAILLGLLAGVHYYRLARAGDAARWLHGVFADLYLREDFAAVREVLEYDYARAEPLLGAAAQHAPAAPADARFLRDLDGLLSYLDHVLYLEGDGHLSRRDRQAVLGRWFVLLTRPDRSALRAHVAARGFTRIDAALDAFPGEPLARKPSLLHTFVQLGAEPQSTT